jgi:hypothetical protein
MQKTLLAVLAFLSLLSLLASGSLAAEDARTEELGAAARAGNVAGVARLLDAGVDANAKGRYDQTALFVAAGKGRLLVVELLLARGAAASARDTFYGATPLSWAVEGGHAEVARRLVEAGAAVAGSSGARRGRRSPPGAPPPSCGVRRATRSSPTAPPSAPMTRRRARCSGPSVRTPRSRSRRR